MEEEITLEEAEREIEKHIKFLDSFCPTLRYTSEEITDSKKAQEFYKKWESGAYSFKSILYFFDARYSYFYNKTALGKREMNDRLELLAYLYEKVPAFKEEIYKIRRENLKLTGTPEKIEFTFAGEAEEMLFSEYENTNKKEVDNDFFGELAMAKTTIREKFNLASCWDDALTCQIASPEIIQRTIVKNTTPERAIHISESLGGTLTIKISIPEMKKEALEALWKVIKDIPSKPIREGYVGIQEMIAYDREKNDLSWKELSEKYGIPADNIRQKIYYDSKK